MENELLKNLPNIDIKIIPHSEQRYPTIGDYWEDSEGTHIRISETIAEYEILILIHELIEYYLIKKAGTPIEDIDKFDKDFEALREANEPLIGKQEPGNMVSAPYHKEHMIATHIERQLAQAMGINWEKYETDLDSL